MNFGDGLKMSGSGGSCPVCGIGFNDKFLFQNQNFKN
jgi:hypothetical protein